MHLPRLALVTLSLAALLAPAAGSLHSADDGVITTDTGFRSFYVPLSTAIWWDHSQVRGIPTGLQEQTHLIELDISPGTKVLVTAETFPRNTPDTPKVCVPASTPTVYAPIAGTAIVHGGDGKQTCAKANGYSVQIHYFPWTNDINDPDHVVSPTPGTPLATTVWRVDAVPLSFKSAILEAGHWQVWFDPAVSAGEYDVVWRARTLSGGAFYFDYLGTRGCLFYFNVAGIKDTDLFGCNMGYI